MDDSNSLMFNLLTLALPDEGGGAPPVPPPGNLNPPIPDIPQFYLEFLKNINKQYKYIKINA